MHRKIDRIKVKKPRKSSYFLLSPLPVLSFVVQFVLFMCLVFAAAFAKIQKKKKKIKKTEEFKNFPKTDIYNEILE